MKYLRAFALIEVLIAAGIVAIGIAAAALLTNSMLIQQQGNNAVTMGLNLQEQTCRLYQLGLDQAAIIAVLPESVSTNAPTNQTQYRLTLVAAPNPVASITNQSVTNTIIFPAGLRQGATNIYRTNSVLVIRDGIR